MIKKEGRLKIARNLMKTGVEILKLVYYSRTPLCYGTGQSGYSFVAQDTVPDSWAGLGMVLGAFRVNFLLVLPIPPPAPELGAIRITLTKPTGGQDRLVFCVPIPLLLRRRLTHVLPPPTLRAAWRWLLLTTHSSSSRQAFIYFPFLTYPAGFVALPFRGRCRCGC